MEDKVLTGEGGRGTVLELLGCLGGLGLPGPQDVAALSELFEKWASQYRAAYDKNSLFYGDQALLDEEQNEMGVEGGASGASGATATTHTSDMELVDSSEGWSLLHGRMDQALLGQPPKRARSINAISYHCTPFMSTISGSHHCASLFGKRVASIVDEKGEVVPLYDVSHLGLAEGDQPRLIPLPVNYTELYNTIKEDSGAASMEEPAICLVCGAVLSSGPKQQRRTVRRAEEGDCTIHARSCGSGSGIFLLVKRSNVLLMSRSRAAFYPVSIVV